MVLLEEGNPKKSERLLGERGGDMGIFVTSRLLDELQPRVRAGKASHFGQPAAILLPVPLPRLSIQLSGCRSNPSS